jgi:hypothetical protein
VAFGLRGGFSPALSRDIAYVLLIKFEQFLLFTLQIDFEVESGPV